MTGQPEMRSPVGGAIDNQEQWRRVNRSDNKSRPSLRALWIGER